MGKSYGLRWSNNIHVQVEAVFQSIKGIGEKKCDNPNGIRSVGTWNLYRSECHKLAAFLQHNGCNNILDAKSVETLTATFLEKCLKDAIENGRSLQTGQTRNAALGKFQHAINTFVEKNNITKIRGVSVNKEDLKIDLSSIRKDYSNRISKLLDRSSREYDRRAYPDPQNLIKYIDNPVHQLQARIQFESGCRAEGVGAPSNGHDNPLTSKNLGGIGKDPVTNKQVGKITTIEKGGKVTEHYISKETFRDLKEALRLGSQLRSDYKHYLHSINEAAKITGQYCIGRGSHALKHNFAQNRYQDCVKKGFSHEQALQQVSLETSHYRFSETYTYIK